MKRIAIILGLLMFTQAAFAGGTVLYMNNGYDSVSQPQQVAPVDSNSTLHTAEGVYNNDAVSAPTSQTTTTRRVRFGGGQKNDPNVYWNFGGINFGSGFTTTGAQTKQY